MSSPDLDFQSLKKEAEQKLPLFDLFKHYGKSPDPGCLTRYRDCPECGGSPGKFRIKDERYFHCYVPSCSLNPDNLPGGLTADAAGLVSVMEGVDSKQGFFRYLSLAGVIDEETYDRLTGAKPAKTKPKAPKPPKVETPAPGETDDGDESDGAEMPSLQSDRWEDNEDDTPSNIVAIDSPPNERDSLPSDGNPWHDLWQSMRLSDGHRTQLMGERGLSRSTIDTCGFKTSRSGNITLIEALRKRYEDEELVEVGILRNDDKRGYRPEPQLCGWGITNEKDPETGKRKFKEVNPVLIPYFGRDGMVGTMRAHKGGLPKRILPGEIGYTNFSQPYGQHLLQPKGKKPRRCLITEGEIKAAAAYQCDIPTLAVPGISFISNEGFRKLLIKILRMNFIGEVVVIYDNEVKDDPSLPGYKEDESKRYDVYVWANVLAYYLEREAGIKVRIGQLPDEYRVKGKADFDGILQQCVKDADGDIVQGTKAAKEIFHRCLDEAHKPADYLSELFPNRAQQIINSLVVRYTRVRKIAIGGDDERTLSYLFRRQHPALAMALREVDGCYYVRKNPTKENVTEWKKSRDAALTMLEKLEADKASAKDIRACRIEISSLDQLLLGWPEAISNFSLQCLYRVTGEETGAIDYYCKAWIPSERRKYHMRISAKQLSRLAEFRNFVLENLGSTFTGGERDLQAITWDLNTDCRYREVNEVNSYGANEDSGLFLFGDCAWNEEGKRILPDSDMVFWHGETGFQLDTNPARLGEGFDQGAPMMVPDEPDREDFQERLIEWCVDMRDTIGGMEAWALIGTAVGYLAMPAFFKEFGHQHPGIWLHGTYGEGKSQTAKWLMRMFGFKELDGPGLTSASDVGIGRVLAQYSCLPVFLDEYRGGEISDSKNSMLRYAFDRSAAPKGRIDHRLRTRTLKPATTPLVCGESECFDAATRSRYVQAVISKARRAMDPGKKRFYRLQQFAPHLHQVTRKLLDNRPRFEMAFLNAYRTWIKEVEKLNINQKINDRAGVTHGVAFAGMVALVDICGLTRMDSAMNQEYLKFLMDYMTMADSDTRSAGVIDTFWEQFFSGIRQNQIKDKHLKLVHVIPHATNSQRVSVCSAAETGARECVLINRTDCFAQFEEYYRRRGKEFPLNMDNLNKYLREQPYWVWKDRSSQWKQRFDKMTVTVWGIYPDAFPWSDEIMELLPQEQEML